MKHIIELKNISIEIPVFDVRRSFRQSIVNKLGASINQGEKKKIFVQALKNVSFSVSPGDRVGVVGHNGSGKTTLLRLLANIYKPTKGTYICRGTVTSLFSVGLGQDADDSGLENIKTMGMVLGLSKKEISQKIDDIVEFSELGDFIHLPIRTYSTGMSTRLSFAIATSLEPDILLMDEGIGAGDASFTVKAEQRLKQFYGRLKSLLVASHSDNLIRQLCNKAILLEHGSIKAMGGVEEILDLYHGGN